MINSIKTAAKAKVKKKRKISLATREIEDVVYHSFLLRKVIIVIVARTGTLEALKVILNDLPKTVPPIIILQLFTEISNLLSKEIKKTLNSRIILK